MPQIRFIKVRCEKCGTEYKIRLERVAKPDSVECVTCGYKIDLSLYRNMLDAIQEFSNLVLKLEKQFDIAGDTLIPNTGPQVIHFFE